MWTVNVKVWRINIIDIFRVVTDGLVLHLLLPIQLVPRTHEHTHTHIYSSRQKDVWFILGWKELFTTSDMNELKGKSEEQRLSEFPNVWLTMNEDDIPWR